MTRTAAFLFTLLVSTGAAMAQVGPELYLPATPAQVRQYSSASVAISNALQFRAARFLCTSDCYISLSPSGTTLPATAASGIYLPSKIPAFFEVRPGMTVRVIQDSASGSINVIELSK